MKSYRSFFIHPLLFAMWPVLFLYSECMDTVALSHLMRPILFMGAITLVLLFLLYWRTKDMERWALGLSIFLIWFFSYGYVRCALPLRHRYLLPLYSLLLVAILIWLARTRISIKSLTRTANTMAVVLVGFSLVRIGMFEGKMYFQSKNLGKNNPHEEKISLSNLPLGYLPDIYYIILDSYTRSDILKERYREDNSAFIEALEKRGFFVASKGHSNYPQTTLSIISALNLDYLHNLGRTPLPLLLINNRVCSFLKKWGYKIVSFPTSWEAIDYFPSDVKWTRGLTISNFESGLFHTTVLEGAVLSLRPLGLFKRVSTVRSDTLFVFANLPQVSKSVERGPRFVFVHLMPPHGPFVFGRHGEDISPHSGLQVKAYYEGPYQIFAQRYADQVAFVSSILPQVIDGILANSPKPPIIIIQGDHGPRAEKEYYDMSKFVWEDVFPILNAYYLPGHCKVLLRDTISPVNTFRVIFNYYFGQDFDILEDDTYLGHPGKPYDFIKVEQPKVSSSDQKSTILTLRTMK